MNFVGVVWWVGRRARDHEVAAEIIRSGILLGTIKRDKYLPSEHVLTVLMGITRYSVRVALAQLAAEGLIQKVHGRGSLVLDVVTNANVSVLPAMMHHRPDVYGGMQELLKYRAAQMLLAIGALIASKRVPSQPAEDTLFELSDLTESHWYTRRVIDLEEWVWGLLGSSVRNAAVRLNVHRIRRLLSSFHDRIEPTTKLEPQTQLFSELFLAIKEGDRIRAYALAETGLNARNRLYLELSSSPDRSNGGGADAPDAVAPAMDG